MRGVLVSVVCLLATSAAARAQGSYLYQPAFAIDHGLRGPVEPYTPQPGDIMLRLDRSVFWRVEL